jgi:hypothetical protein
MRTQAQGQPHSDATLSAPRPAALQPQNRAGLPAQGGLPTILGLQLTDLGRQIPRRLVPTGHALAHRADEESRPNPTGPSRTLILNYFRAKKQFSSGVVEGLDNKAKPTMRKSYGFRTYHVTEIALYHALGKLPEPETTHRFCGRTI